MFVSLGLALSACAGSSAKQPVTPVEPSAAAPVEEGAASAAGVDASAIVDATDRSEEDLETDERREPVKMLRFMGLRPGMKVADIGAGTGYTTELLARAVGTEGVVYGQNPAFVLERFAEAGWSERLKKPVMANVVRVDREFVDPLPPAARGLDLVVNVMFYHDFVWMKVDRDAHNRAVFEALAPGGHYVIVDHSAAIGRGVEDVQTLHRIEESVLRQEIERAGFVLVAEADFLRNPGDTRDWNALPWVDEDRTELSDRFVLMFQKPAAAQ